MKVSGIISTCLFLLSGILFSQCAWYRETVLSTQVKSARSDFESRNYANAVIKYNHLFEVYPESPEKQNFLLQKGIALYLMNSHDSAARTFRHYLRLYPQGLYHTEAEAYLTKIAALSAEKQRNYTIQKKQLKVDISHLKAMLKADPYNSRVHYQLANKLWALGEYDDAARHYLKAGEIDAALKENELIKNRLIINDEGEAVPMTPALQSEIEKENHPLVIFDQHSYYQRAKPSYLGVEKSFRTVTGKVRNQSSQVLQNVTVSVDFYNVRREILDTKTYYIGTMGPNEVRAFLVKGRNYDNLYNIEDVECHAYYH